MSTVSSTSGESVLCKTYHAPTSYSLLQSKTKNVPLKTLTAILALVCLLLTLTVIILTVLPRFSIGDPRVEDSCLVKDGIDSMELYNGRADVFSDLHDYEIKIIVDFIHGQRHLNLTLPQDAGLNSNYIHVVEMISPPKQEVLLYLDKKGPRPQRMARAFIFRGGLQEPVVEEYLVGPLPNPNSMSLMKTNSRKTTIPYNVRPFSAFELKAFRVHALPKILGRIYNVLKESYNATLDNCAKKCLRFMITPVSSGFLEPGRRKSWFWFAYDLEFYTLHPLDFQFLVDTTDSDPRRWEIQKIFYANQLFQSIDELLEKYAGNNINKTRSSFPVLPTEDQYSAVYLRGVPVPNENRPPPQQVQPAGPRYTVNGNLVQYMDWRFNVRVSPTFGTQFFDIRYKGERIIYELSMQEIAVLYSGHSPAASMLYFADSAGLFGTRMRGMMPGMDCPDYATMLDAVMYTSNDKGTRRFENSMCIFEHSPETPLRRHRAYGMSGAFYSGLIDYVLVVRMYICIINYDYVFDFVFHNNGGIEVKVSATGYLATSFYYPEEEKFGTRISKNVVAGLHHHLFHFKADVDINGVDNRFQTLNIGAERKTNVWAEDPTRGHTQNYFRSEYKSTEREALYDFDFHHPKYLLFSSNKPTELGHTPSYRLIHKGMTKAILPEGEGFEPSVSWGRHQMAVTRQKDDEMSSSSMFAMWDAEDPVVSFKKYWEDNEDILDKDIVAWITLGSYHIPQTENVPTTATVGTTQSFFLVPFNYFNEDPSLASRDAVKIMPLDPRSPNSGAAINRHNMSLFFDCETKRIDQRLSRNSTFLFS
ncbi:unnamed protein product [Lymnaea stagnalis]|uniref:Amine oxidase n=1 Tax=Lymnaea stagnalis TaxID=6523 RepID=A0AAV2HK07_LYMST